MVLWHFFWSQCARTILGISILFKFGFEKVRFSFKINSIGNTYFKSIFSKMHKIFVSQKSHGLLGLVKGKLALHQKVSVEGLLITSEFVTENGKCRTTSQVMVGGMRILEDFAVASGDANKTEKIDENSVEIFGYITEDIKGDEFRTFELAYLK